MYEPEKTMLKLQKFLLEESGKDRSDFVRLWYWHIKSTFPSISEDHLEKLFLKTNQYLNHHSDSFMDDFKREHALYYSRTPRPQNIEELMERGVDEFSDIYFATVNKFLLTEAKKLGCKIQQPIYIG